MGGSDELLIGEATRLCRRYVDEVVLEFRLCPWAAPALLQNRVAILVQTSAIESEAEFADPAKNLAQTLAEPSLEPYEILLLPLPRFALGRLSLDAFLRQVRLELSARVAPSEAPFALAAFHPEATLDDKNAERMIPFLRRSPDPMIQAVRSEHLRRLEDVDAPGTGFVSAADLLTLATARERLTLRKRVAEENRRTLADRGVESFEAAIQSIIADREASYSKLGLAPQRPEHPSGEHA